MSLKRFFVCLTACTGMLFSSVSFGGADTPESMRQLAAKVTKELWNQHDLSAIDRYFAKDYIQHGMGKDGSDGLKEFASGYFKKFPNFKVEDKHYVVEKDRIVIISATKNDEKDRGELCFDMFRVANGKFAEHWGACEAVPETRFNNNTPW